MNCNKKHVLIVLQASSLSEPYLSTGGVDTVSKTLLEGFKNYKSDSFKYSFLIFDPLNRQLPQTEFSLGVHTCYLENFKNNKRPTFIHNALVVRKYIDFLKPDIVHCHQDSWVIGAAFKKVKKIVTLHGYRNICRKSVGLINDFLYERVFPYLSDMIVDNYTCVSESFKTQLPSKVKVKTSVIYNPISLNFSRVSSSFKEYDKPILVFTGLLIPRKQVEFCFEILNELINKKIDAKLLVVGPAIDSNYFQFLKEYLHRLGLEKHVDFVGHLDAYELNELYNKSHFGVSFSREETFGLVPLEMFNSGLIVFSTAVGVLSECEINSKCIFTYKLDEPDLKTKVANEIFDICNNQVIPDSINFRISKFAASTVIGDYEKAYISKN